MVLYKYYREIHSNIKTTGLHYSILSCRSVTIKSYLTCTILQYVFHNDFKYHNKKYNN